MSGIIRRRNFFLDEEEIVEETNRLIKERELQEQRIRDEAYAEAERFREQQKKQVELDELVNRGFNWLTSLSDDSPSKPEAPDILDEEDFSLGDWFNQFQIIEDNIRYQLAGKKLDFINKDNFGDEFDEINQYGIIKLAFSQDKFFDFLIQLESFKVVVNYFTEKLKSNQYMDQSTLTFQNDNNNYLAILINDENFRLKEKFKSNKNFIYYKEVFKQDDLDYVKTFNVHKDFNKYDEWNIKRHHIIENINKDKIVYFDDELLFERLVHDQDINRVCIIRDPPFYENKDGKLVRRKANRNLNDRFNGYRRIDDSFNIVTKIAGDFRDRKLLTYKFHKKKILSDIKITKFLNT